MVHLRRKHLSKSNTADRKIYSCNQCEFKGSQSSMWYHKQSVHKGILYPCDLCDFTSHKFSNVKAHKEYKHAMVRFPRDQCEINATQK